MSLSAKTFGDLNPRPAICDLRTSDMSGMVIVKGLKNARRSAGKEKQVSEDESVTKTAKLGLASTCKKQV